MKYSTGNKKNIKLVFCLLALIFLFGCAELTLSQKEKQESVAWFEKWSTLADNSKGHTPSATPKEINTAAILSKKQTPSPSFGETSEKKLPNSPINLTMRQADLKAVLRAMAKSIGVNILVKNELKGDISVDFRGVAWDKAFTGLLRTYGLSYIWEDSIIRVMTIEDVDQELKRKVQLRDIQWVEPLLEPMVINIDYADPVKLSATLQDFLTKDKDGKPRGSIKVDVHSNSLIISAMRDDLIKILPIIEKLDKPTHQILIKANIVETTQGMARDLGIMWGGYNQSTHGNDDLIVTGGSASPPGALGGKGLGVNFPADVTATTASGVFRFIIRKDRGEFIGGTVAGLTEG